MVGAICGLRPPSLLACSGLRLDLGPCHCGYSASPQLCNRSGVPALIDGVAFRALIADKSFDSNAIIADLDARGAKVVISQSLSGKIMRDYRAFSA